MEVISHQVFKLEYFSSVLNKEYRNCTFTGCEFLDIEELAAIYNTRFIECAFDDCTFRVNASYSSFLKCTFTKCSMGDPAKRSTYSIFYRCNLDGSSFDEIKGAKFKMSSLNGSVVLKMEKSTMVKCSNKYLRVEEYVEGVVKVSKSNTTRRLGSVGSPVNKSMWWMPWR